MVLKPTIHKEICVLCGKGKTQRVQQIQKLLKSVCGDEDQQHEARFMCSVLEKDIKNDVCLSLPCSIVVFENNGNKTLCEFDGLLIFPNRTEGQVIFMEAKNKKDKGKSRNGLEEAKDCLMEKFDKLKLHYEEEKILVKGKDAIFTYDIETRR